MVRTSPGIRIATFLSVFVVVFSLAGQAQNSNGSATTQAQVGQKVLLEGVLEIRVEDAKGQGRVFYSLKRQDGTRIPLQFQKNPPRNVSTGDHVRATGQMSGGRLILYSGSTDLTKTSTTSGNTNTGSGGTTSSSIPVPNTFGPQSTLIILFNFQDYAIEPWTVSDVQNMYSGTVNDFFVENSYGQTSIVPTVVGWFTIPDSVATCNTSQMATDAKSAAVAAGVNLSNYTRYVYVFPFDNACAFAGSSTVGGKPSESWINGSGWDFHTLNHELGHAFGLWHAHALDCGTSATICSNGNSIEYGDLMDTMGTTADWFPDYTAFQKERLGWLNYGASPSIQTVTTSGTYTINPYESGGPGPNALKILQSTDPTTGARTWYYLEARQPIGFDAFLTKSTFPYVETVDSGVIFHLGTDGNDNSSELIDLTPATPTYQQWWDMSLAAGQSYTDSAAGVTFNVTSVSGGGATVQITIKGSSCSSASPTVSMTPSQSQSVTAGTAVNFTATVTDNDSSGCSSATFNLADVIPTGWAGSWNTSSLSLSPGKSGSATLTVTSPTGTAGGLYNVAANAIDAGATSYSGSAVATYVVATSGPLAVNVSTNQPSYLPGQTVAITVTVLAGTSPASGVGVTATITNPNGKLTTLKGKTGSAGTALLSYKLSRGAPAGTYKVGATATSSTSASSAATATAIANASFTVQ